MRKLLVLIILLPFTVFGYDITPTKSMFNYTIDFNAPTTEKTYTIPVTDHIYQHSILSDLLIFNNKGEIVPFVIMPPKPLSYKEARSTNASYFNLEMKKPIDKDDKTIYPAEIVVKLEDGDIYESLEITLKANKDFNAKLDLYTYGGDMSKWHWLKSSALTRLTSSKNEILIENKVQIQNLNNNGYIKIAITPPETAQYITGIILNGRKVPVYEKPETSTITGYINDKNNLIFDKKSNFPVKWVEFSIPESYLLPEYSIYLYENQEKLDNKTNAKTLIKSSKYAKNNEYNIYGVDGKENRWPIWEMIVGSTPDNSTAKFYWYRDNIIFMAKGDGPFTIAYGNKNFIPDGQILKSAEILKDSAHKAETGYLTQSPKTINGGNSIFHNIEKPASTLPKYIPYLAIIIIIMVLSVLTLKLIKDTNKK